MNDCQKTDCKLAPRCSRSPLLSRLEGVGHGFFGAAGGVSRGVYASLNCAYSSQDRRESIDENRTRVAHSFGLEAGRLHSLRQAHTTHVVGLDRDSGPQFEQRADGMVSREPGVALGPLGADCAPVLYADPVNRVIGAAHSGWKGALTGINEAVIEAMLGLGASVEQIHVAIGPAMQVQHYEVQADFRAQFEAQSPIDVNPCFIQRDGRLYFDTPAYIEARLKAAGITRIDVSKLDTYTGRGQFFSYRRGRQQGAPDYGRQISVIVLQGD